MIRPAFVEPVLDAQDCFRAVLEAMSRPGRVQRLTMALDAPAPLAPASAAVLLTLVDAEAPLWLDAGEEAEGWIRFHAGCPLAVQAEASFLLATGTPPALADLRQGSDETPQDGATLIIQVESLEEGAGWHLTGPGIEKEHRLNVTGLPPGFASERSRLAKNYPRGVDIILCAGDRLAALPRTTRIEEG
ncbi:phosphonate C-P lyase system protein PhnH [Pseudoroseomonas deserti]|uniref:Phosphonate C-P lyase system protein PhnH n=1 Tax=Teichococcus deserti TaxID=1817963 RepID=A0A1V2H8B0_9PROT|nr:phosphonate C-P lyase system protein PhnH [Pseudoroseomonas deserti]ONG57260.1 phosphonate C-P lyase system protein PhnH [Pseudoroseomonas deserti]